MPLATETEMSDAEIDDFLGRNETGVLSLARKGEPYAIPISYGFDRASRTFYFRLVSNAESQKRDFLESSPAARLVVYEQNNDGSIYWSVVGSGSLEEIDPDSLSIEQIEQYGAARRPLFEIWGAGKDDLDIQLFEFAPEELSGRRTAVDRSK